MQAYHIVSMDESTAIHPSLLPQRTHVQVVAESDWERAYGSVTIRKVREDGYSLVDQEVELGFRQASESAGEIHRTMIGSPRPWAVGLVLGRAPAFDHRRVGNLRVFFERMQASQPHDADFSAFAPGASSGPSTRG